MHMSGGSSLVPFRWPIVMQMSPPVLQGRRGWVSRLPRPRFPPRPEDTSILSKAPRAPRKRDAQHRVPGLVEHAGLAVGPCPRRLLRLSPGTVAWLLHTPGTCASAAGGHLFPARAPALGTARATGRLPSAARAGRESCGRSGPGLSLRGTSSTAHAVTAAHLSGHTDRALRESRPGSLSPSRPARSRCDTCVFAGGWVLGPRSWFISHRKCSGRWSGLSLH